ncbi:MAG: hypothetical protein WCQ50_15755 [Spirochaetota bacterium]
MAVDRGEARAAGAALALAVIEGFVLLDALDFGDVIGDALKGPVLTD